jgi:hypothetical protein
VIAVVPIGKLNPLAGPARVKVAEQLSVAVGAVQVATAPQAPGAAVNTISVGQPLSNGACVSITVTVKEHGAEVLVPSDALAVTVVTPTGKEVPGFFE